MHRNDVILKTQALLKDKFTTKHSGHHDYWHMYRVWKLAKYIASKEAEADLFVVELAALLHDIADWKFHDGDEEAGPRAAREWLTSLRVDDTTIKHVEEIIRHLDFKGADVAMHLSTLEAKIVHDADKLDAMGAIGIARAFATGAHFNESFHNPEATVPTYTSAEEYRAAKGAEGRTVINHFYEKLLLLKDRMFTETGSELAQHRHDVMEQFVKEFLDEWESRPLA